MHTNRYICIYEHTLHISIWCVYMYMYMYKHTYVVKTLEEIYKIILTITING